MHRDPCVYLILCVDTNGDVTYSTAHLFDHQGEIWRTRVAHGDNYPMPHDELAEMLEWGAAQLNDFFMDAVGPAAT